MSMATPSLSMVAGWLGNPELSVLLNRPIAGMSISFPTFRYDPAKEGEVVPVLTDASRDISSRLGCAAFPLNMS